MEIDIFDDDSYICAWTDDGGEIPMPGGGFGTEDAGSPESPESFADVTVVNESFIEEPFVPEETAPQIDLGVPQIGVPVFTLDPVIGTDPTAEIMGGDTGAGE